MMVSELRGFRAEVVDALKSNPQWRKVKRHRYDLVVSVVPDATGARTYWRIRNGTQGLARKYANRDETAHICLGSAYDLNGDYRLDPEDARLVKRWRCEFADLLAHQGGGV